MLGLVSLTSLRVLIKIYANDQLLVIIFKLLYTRYFLEERVPALLFLSAIDL